MATRTAARTESRLRRQNHLRRFHEVSRFGRDMLFLMSEARYPAAIEIRPVVPEHADGIALRVSRKCRISESGH